MRVYCRDVFASSLPIIRKWFDELAEMGFSAETIKKRINEVGQALCLIKVRLNKTRFHRFYRGPLENYARRKLSVDYYLPKAVLGLALLEAGVTLDIDSEGYFKVAIDKRDIAKWEATRNFYQINFGAIV